MFAISISLVNPGRTAFRGCPVSRGVPLPVGACRDVGELRAHVDGAGFVHQLTPLTRWPDGSLRWVLLEHLIDMAASERIVVSLVRRTDESSPEGAERPSVRSGKGHLDVTLDEDGGSAIPRLSIGDRVLRPLDRADIELRDGDGEHLAFRASRAIEVERGAVRSSFRGGGEFVDRSGERFVEVDVRVDVFGAPSLVTLRVTVHNPDAARHAGGFWDLGDPGSRRFADLSIAFPATDDAELSWRSDVDAEWRTAGADDFALSQLTSGGSLPDSPNHVDASGRVPAPEPGFRASVDGRIVERGERSSPCVRLSSGDRSETFCLESFWQNFPKALRREDERLRIGLFPSDYPEVFELQGGEKKTHVLHVVLDGTAPDWVPGGPVCEVDLRSWAAANVLPYHGDETSDEVMDALIAGAFDEFLAKRERMDEYGWRHFGDVHADHETWGRDPSEPFSSHYNNQYDLLYGFLRQFALGGQPEWFALARDLAAHVVDIDLYDTDADRLEYNGGLFWHTDHYRPAHTCTHRTYSVRHRQDDDSVRGGGPGGEHCYTTGLKLYYLMSGCENARSAVFSLARWVGYFYDGSGTVLEELRRLSGSRARLALDVMRGHDVPRHRYPMHRGIGNLVVAQLDAFEIGGDRAFLERAERVVLDTVGPGDDLRARNLDDVEGTWFYTVFLQALIRYLDIKRSMREFDEAFFYARDSLLHYADWMAINEKPYLDDPDALEYPNHTWVAQEIRRCAVLLDAFRYSPSERRDLLERARFFARYVTEELRDEPTRTYTRILAILMQNHGASAQALAEPERHAIPAPVPYVADRHVPHTLASVANESARALVLALGRTTPGAEWRWLRTRLS